MSREVICGRLSLQCGVSYEELYRLSVEVKLPWCGEELEGCKGLCLNEGLYTQCVRALSSSSSSCEYCLECSVKRKGSGWLGSVSDRMSCEIGEYRVGGRREESYLKVMKKHGITREMAERSARGCGKSIPEKHFEERIEEKKCRGRPRQKKESSSSVKVEKRGRGRPRKEKTVRSNSDGEELIASLIEAEGKEEEEEEIKVNKIELDGKMYLKSEDNVLYDFVSHEEIGKWNEKENKME